MKHSEVVNYLQITEFHGKTVKKETGFTCLAFVVLAFVHDVMGKIKDRLHLSFFFFAISDRRHDSALDDGSDNNINLVGGYYDAG
jgi:hypothetical protein